jgi:hypothetical protein
MLPNVTAYWCAIPVKRGKPVSVYVDPMAAPVPVIPTPQRADNGYAEPPEAEIADDYAIEETGEIIGPKCGIGPWAVNYRRIINRNIYDLWAGWLDRNKLALGCYRFLWRRL